MATVRFFRVSVVVLSEEMVLIAAFGRDQSVPVVMLECSRATARNLSSEINDALRRDRDGPVD